MIKIFADTDICIDLLSGREPFNTTAERIFSLSDEGKIKIFVSSLSIANIDYVLQSQYSIKNRRQVIFKFKTLVEILAVDKKIIELSLSSDFNDFEDAIQYFTALENRLNNFVTRNVKDYKKAEINVMLPEVFLSNYL